MTASASEEGAGRAQRSRRGVSLRRKAAFLAMLTLMLAADFWGAPLTDPVAAQRRGYSHHFAFPANALYVDELWGWKRVAFNFRHFNVWWTRCPRSERIRTVADFLRCDGNSAAVNLGGHFGGSFLLTLAGLAIWPVPRVILLCGMLVNVFHEYVAEGRYVDPSFVDLWLDTLGLVLAVGALQAGRRLGLIHWGPKAIL